MTTIATINTIHQYQQSRSSKQTRDMTAKNLNQQLDAFFRSQQKQAYTIALISVRQQTDALDVLQDTMLAFVKTYKHKPQDSWKPLFYRILQNKINDHHRKQKSWLRHFFSSKDSEDTTDNTSLATAHISTQPSPLQLVETQETGNQMINIIKQLPKQQQQVVMYRHWQQMSVEETAQIMEISTGSVKTHLYRASQKIKQTLGTSND